MELKSCPFCGGKAKYFAYGDGGVCVKCVNCLCQTQARSDYCIEDCKKQNAVEKISNDWNSRVTDA